MKIKNLNDVRVEGFLQIVLITQALSPSVRSRVHCLGHGGEELARETPAPQTAAEGPVLHAETPAPQETREGVCVCVFAVRQTGMGNICTSCVDSFIDFNGSIIVLGSP